MIRGEISRAGVREEGSELSKDIGERAGDDEAPEHRGYGEMEGVQQLRWQQVAPIQVKGGNQFSHAWRRWRWRWQRWQDGSAGAGGFRSLIRGD